MQGPYQSFRPHHQNFLLKKRRDVCITITHTVLAVIRVIAPHCRYHISCPRSWASDRACVSQCSPLLGQPLLRFHERSAGGGNGTSSSYAHRANWLGSRQRVFKDADSMYTGNEMLSRDKRVRVLAKICKMRATEY